MKPQIRELGIPVRSVNWVQLHQGHNRAGAPCIYAIMGQQADNLFVLQIDPETGAFRQFVSPVPKSQYPTATFLSRGGRLYVGSSYAGHLLCFDPEQEDLLDLGAIHPGAATFPCRIDEGADGRLWIGSYGTADLTSYDPATGEFTRYGRMDPVDMYNYPLVNSDGTVACLIRVTRPHVVLLDPSSGEKRAVGPVVTQGEGTLDLRRTANGQLYIVSSLGNFRIDGMEAVPVEAVPDAPSRDDTDRMTAVFTDAGEQRYRRLQVRKPDGETRTFELEYETAGSDLFYVHAGPDGCVYGSSVLPLHLFRYNPNDGELIDLGVCSQAAGEAYSMGNLDGKLYIASYPGARLSVYDPSQGYRFGDQPGDNPRDLGRIDDLSYRPRSMLTGPLGRVWTASLPDYGCWGGPLSWYDPQSEERHAYYRIWGDGSAYTLAHLEAEGLIAVGTSIAGGSGTQPKVDQAALFLWDYRAEHTVWEGTPDRPVTEFNALLTGPDGRLYATVRGGGVPGELVVFDPPSRRFTHRLTLPPGQPVDLGLQNGPDGRIYGLTTACLYRLDPATLTIEEVLREEGVCSVAGPIRGNAIYFAAGHRLRSATIRMG